MNWLLLFHITSIIVWSGSLLYLPILIITFYSNRDCLDQASLPHLPRRFFTHLLTPIGLAAIISGSLIFIQYHIISLWLIVKITLVLCLVMNHVFNGLLILQMENGSIKKPHFRCLLSNIISLILIIAIIWLVLTKPTLDI